MYSQQENLRRMFAKQDIFQQKRSTTMPNGFLFFFFLVLLLPLCVGVSYLILFYVVPRIISSLANISRRREQNVLLIALNSQLFMSVGCVIFGRFVCNINSSVDEDGLKT